MGLGMQRLLLEAGCGLKEGVSNGSLEGSLECLIRKSARVPQPHVSTPDEIQGLLTV